MAHSLDIEEILDMIIEGDSYRVIARKLNMPVSTLHRFTSKPEHSARVREALRISSHSHSDKAEDVLINAERDPVEMQRARELAHHYRWLSAKRDPSTYGDKMHHEIKEVTEQPFFPDTISKPNGLPEDNSDK